MILKEEHSILHSRYRSNGDVMKCICHKKMHTLICLKNVSCHRRLSGLLKRLSPNPEQLQQYNTHAGSTWSVILPVMKMEGFIIPRIRLCFYKQTTKLRVVHNASDRKDSPSLNDCLFTGSNVRQNISNTLLTFRCIE